MTVSQSQPGSDRAAIEARLAELYAAQERATGWGAAVGARHEEIKALEGQLRAMTASAPCPTPAWGAKVAQQATAQSEAVAWLIERKDGYVEITRHKEAADGWASVAKITPLGPLATPPAFPARRIKQLADDCRAAAEIYEKSPGLAGHGVNAGTVIDIYRRIAMALDEIDALQGPKP